ncbi:molybdenum cofactor carrier [Gigaspora margarita]|uniref:Molybdenum cofactor carrier n=1 Tax=Gigaspora margarita TaxID=4874 RepID=A0A8H4AIN3_GIGMA|nr:molybdenum cofactor carrier [Gigaspora margarita]
MSHRHEIFLKLFFNGFIMIQPNFIIRSGGQTGVDRGTLDATMDFNEANAPNVINITGWCPLGRKAEDGPIHKRYPLLETTTDDYSQRTEQNIIDSTGTLILLLEKNNSDNGTNYTIEKASEFNKPLEKIYFSDNYQTNIEQVLKWLNEKQIRHLNVGGPRESNAPGIYDKTHSFILDLLYEMSNSPILF